MVTDSNEDVDDTDSDTDDDEDDSPVVSKILTAEAAETAQAVARAKAKMITGVFNIFFHLYGESVVRTTTKFPANIFKAGMRRLGESDETFIPDRRISVDPDKVYNTRSKRRRLE